MNPSEVLIKPILTEKANAQQDALRRYTFKVARKSKPTRSCGVMAVLVTQMV